MDKLNPVSDDYDGSTSTGGPDIPALLAGIGVFSILILMCISAAILSKRTRRIRDEREARERQEEAVRRADNLRQRREAAGNAVPSVKLIVPNPSYDSATEAETIQNSFSDVSSVNEPIIPLKAIIGSECIICQLIFREGDTISYSNNPDCKHMYHKHCIVNWLARKDTCPTCRQPFVKKQDGDTNETDTQPLVDSTRRTGGTSSLLDGESDEESSLHYNSVSLFPVTIPDDGNDDNEQGEENSMLSLMSLDQQLVDDLENGSRIIQFGNNDDDDIRVVGEEEIL